MTSTLNPRSRKRRIYAFYALKCETRPEQLQLAGPLSKNLKNVSPRDTNLDSGRELTKSNLFSVRGSAEKEIRRLYRLKLDNHRMNQDRKSGIGVFRSRGFHEEPWARFPLWKKGRPFYCARQKARLARIGFNWREPSRKKGGRNFVPPTRECSGEQIIS